MTTALEQIKALPAKWRQWSDAKYPRGSKARNMSPDVRYEIEGRCEQLDACADELDTALQALRDEAGEADAIERAARYAWEHASWDWSAVKGGLDRFTRPAPAAEAAPQGDPAIRKPAFYTGEVLETMANALKEQDVAAVLEAAEASRSATPPSAPAVSPDRPAAEPGGMECQVCECQVCGRIFVGAEWHSVCGVCMSAPVPQEGVPQDMVLVPREPTPEMLAARPKWCDESEADAVYSAMLAAAPAQGVR